MNISKQTRLSRRSIIAITLILFASISVFANGASEAIVPTGSLDTAVISTGEFTDLSVAGVEGLTIRQGTTEVVKISGDTALVEAVEVVNEDGYLSISGDVKNPLAVTVEITTRDLDGLMLGSVADASLVAWDMDHDFSVVMNADAGLDTVGTLAVKDFYLYNRGGEASEWNVDADMVVIESTSGEIAMSGKADTVSVTATLYGDVSLQDLDIQNGFLTLANDGSVDADFPGVSSVTIQTSQDASATVVMNGMIDATSSGDSSISATGNIAHSTVNESGDSSISIG